MTSFTKTDSISCLYCAAGNHVLEKSFKLERKTHREKLHYLKEKWSVFQLLLHRTLEQELRQARHLQQVQPNAPQYFAHRR